MNQKILVFVGRKQSGKSSAANFVSGYILSQLGRKGFPFCPTNFTIDDDGQLITNTFLTDVDGNTVQGEGLLDLSRKDEDFVLWAENIMWPHVKIYNFADTLKAIAITVFNIPAELVYGGEEEKRQLTHIKWKDMCTFLAPRAVNELKRGGKYDMKMSVREFLQYFGTNVCRKLYNECWVNSCLKQIFADGSEIALIADGRFVNEVSTSKKIGAKIIKFTRQIDEDTHDSEAEIEKIHNSYVDAIIDNQYMTIKEKNQTILDLLYNWGWLSGHVGLN